MSASTYFQALKELVSSRLPASSASSSIQNVWKKLGEAITQLELMENRLQVEKRSVLIEKGQITSKYNAAVSAREQMRQELEALRVSHKKELEALRVSHKKLQSAFEQLHNDPGDDAVIFTFPVEADETVQASITCSRQAIRHWSAAFDALIRHGNSMAGDCPSCVDMKDVSAMVFKQALSFQCSGCFPSESIGGLDQQEHVLLQFADRYDLQDLKEQYIATALEKTPLNLQTTSWHLNLAFAGNHAGHKERCIPILAKGMNCFTGKDQFMKLQLEAAEAVLSHDEIALAGGREKDALACFRQWATHQEERLGQAPRLANCVRFCLLGAQELLDFQEEVETSDVWSTIRPSLSATIRSALAEKLRSDSPARKQKRPSTVLLDEEPLVKALRKTMSIFQVDTGGFSNVGA